MRFAGSRIPCRRPREEMLAVPRVLPITAARVIDGAECLELGIANRLATDKGPAAMAAEWAQVITRQAPLALRAAKRAVLEGRELPMSQALEVERSAYDSLINSADREEGLRAFIEKRPPVWRGR